MRRKPLAGIAIAALAVTVFAACGDDDDSPADTVIEEDVSIPDVSIPDVSMPDVSIPDVSIPDVSIPDITTGS
jgi:hypothetical protein